MWVPPWRPAPAQGNRRATVFAVKWVRRPAALAALPAVGRGPVPCDTAGSGGAVRAPTRTALRTHAEESYLGAYAAALRARPGEEAQAGRRHILLVNRDPALLEVVRVLLQEERYNVTTTNAVPLTFALIAAARPALLVVDLAIAERSGWDLLVRLHARRPPPRSR